MQLLRLKIYDFLGMELTPQAKVEMEQWQAFNRRELRPSHDYTLEQYGFSKAGLTQLFSDYRQAFILNKYSEGENEHD